jgi:hypothetical protein
MTFVLRVPLSGLPQVQERLGCGGKYITVLFVAYSVDMVLVGHLGISSVGHFCRSFSDEVVGGQL